MANTELIPPGLELYSQTEVLNRRFKKMAVYLTLIFVSVLALLALELTGVVPISPFQPNIKSDLHPSDTAPSLYSELSGIPAIDSNPR